MGLFRKRVKPREVTGVPEWQKAAARDMLIEGRRQCTGCRLYFVPSGGEHTCSAACEEVSNRQGRKKRWSR